MRIEDFYVGQSASLKKVFSSDDVKAFAELSLDRNPIHLDEVYAEQSLFGKREQENERSYCKSKIYP